MLDLNQCLFLLCFWLFLDDALNKCLQKQLQSKLLWIPGLDASDLMLFFDDNHVQDEVPLGKRDDGISKWQVVRENPGDKNRGIHLNTSHYSSQN